MKSYSKQAGALGALLGRQRGENEGVTEVLSNQVTNKAPATEQKTAADGGKPGWYPGTAEMWKNDQYVGGKLKSGLNAVVKGVTSGRGVLGTVNPLQGTVAESGQELAENPGRKLMSMAGPAGVLAAGASKAVEDPRGPATKALQSGAFGVGGAMVGTGLSAFDTIKKYFG